MGRLFLVAALAGLVGCGARSVHPGADGIGTDGDADTDADGDTDGDTDCGETGLYAVEIERATTDSLDLLVLVDDSSSMREEQASLAAAFPDLVTALTTPSDEDGDGTPDADAVSSVHLAVVSSDMGTSGFAFPTCEDADRGDDGVFQNLPSPKIAGCDATYPKFLTYDVAAPDGNFANDFACIATLGTGGCAYEQSLAAVEKALTVHAASGAANDGFLRSDALLAILIVTDENDCSVSDPALFAPDADGGDHFRCSENPEMLEPIDELVSSILSVKPGRPNRIVVAAITGVPADLVALDATDLAAGDLQGASDFQAILADPRMQETIDYSPEGAGNRFVPSCDVPGMGIALPPRRIVEFVASLDQEIENGLVQSICQSDWRDAIRAVTRNIQDRVQGLCLSGGLTTPDGERLETREHAECVLTERLTDGRACGVGRFQVGSFEGDTICEVCQLGDGFDYAVDFLGNDLANCNDDDAYWFYTTEDESCGNRGKVEFSDSAEPSDGSVLRLECPTNVMPEPPGC